MVKYWNKRENSYMSQIKKGSRIKIFYTGKLKDGTVFESNIGGSPLEFTVGKGKVIKGFENAVLGMKTDETKTVTIKPADAYGPRDQSLIWVLGSNDFPAGTILEPGQEVSFKHADGHVEEGRITDIQDEKITVDGNHPLAGRHLTFEIKIVSVS
jgi:peptidylprolyl isomerase